MTESPPHLTVATHDGQITLDIICDMDRDIDTLHSRYQSFRFGFDYHIDFMEDSLDELRAKSHLCRQVRSNK